MNSTDISNFVNENIGKIANPNVYKSIIRKDNNLFRFDILNRILIYLQCNDAYDVRTAEEWIIDDRLVKNEDERIYLLFPKYVSRYIDSESGNVIDNESIGINEVNEALKYNIIQKETTIDSIETKVFTDIKNTKSIDDTEYKVAKPILSQKVLLEILVKVTGCTVEKSDMNYYAKNDNTLYLSETSYNGIANIVLSSIMTFFKHEGLIDKYIEEYNIDINEQSKLICEKTIEFMIASSFNCDINTEFSEVANTDINTLIDILNIADDVASIVISNIDYTSDLIKKDATYSINVIRRAEKLLNIMEANSIQKTMKGI